jgi:endogenous inhibitor of DNA gyrase (YacG/DUF329 family)
MKCPNCNKLIEWQGNPYRPFCSERCKLADLSRWVNDEYSVPGEAASIPDQAETAAEPDALRDDDWRAQK